MTYDEMTYLCVYPFGNIMPFTFLNEPLHMTYDVSKRRPHARAEGPGLVLQRVSEASPLEANGRDRGDSPPVERLKSQCMSFCMRQVCYPFFT